MKIRLQLPQLARIRLLAFATIAVTAVISFSSLRNLAERAGFGELSWLFPICLDAVAALGMDLWLSNSPARRGARALALSAIALSTAGNIGDWGIRSSVWLAPLWLAPALGAVPPLGLASLLMVLHRHGRGPAGPLGPPNERHDLGATVTESLQTSRGVRDHPAPITNASATGTGMDLQLALSPGVDDSSTGPVPAPQRKPGTTRRGGSSAKTSRPDAELIGLIRDHERDHGPLSRRGAMSQYGIGSTKATELLTAARNGQVQ